jgi:general secretion pathway protein B
MSYILDALKKSDQQRQRGATPTLPSAQATMAAPKQPVSLYYGVLAVILLGAGIAIGWLHPWNAEQASTKPPVARPAIADPGQTVQTAPAAQAEMADKSQQAWPAPAPTAAAAPTVLPAGSANAGQVLPMSELPFEIQRELPTMTIQLHSYSSKSAGSLVSINSRMLKEGDSLSPGLKLEQITQDGVIFSYKGYRFLFGIR